MTTAQEQPSETPWSEIFFGRYGLYTFLLVLGMSLYAVNQFVVATIMPSIAADLGGVDYYTWSFSLFAVGAIAGSASAAPLRAAWGMRRAFAGAGVVLGIGLAGAAVAGDMPSLVGWRLVQGFGGGAVASHGYGLIAITYPPRLQSRALGVVSTVWGVSTAAGPGFGAIFAEIGIWRGAFWSLLGFAALFSGLAWRLVEGEHGHGRISQIPLGRLALLCLAVLSMSATSLAMPPMGQAALILASIAAAALAFLGDARSEDRIFPRGAALPTSMIGAVCWILFLVSIVLSLSNTFATFFLQALHGVSPLAAGYIFAAQSIMWTVTALAVANAREGRETVFILAGLVVMLAATAAIALFVDAGPVALIAIALAFSGVGLGALNNPVIQSIIAAAPEAEKHAAGTSVQTIRNIGISFGAAIAGLVAAAAGLADGVGRAVTAAAMEWVFGVGAVFAAAGLALVLANMVRSRR